MDCIDNWLVWCIDTCNIKKSRLLYDTQICYGPVIFLERLCHAKYSLRYANPKTTKAYQGQVLLSGVRWSSLWPSSFHWYATGSRRICTYYRWKTWVKLLTCHIRISLWLGLDRRAPWSTVPLLCRCSTVGITGRTGPAFLADRRTGWSCYYDYCDGQCESIYTSKSRQDKLDQLLVPLPFIPKHRDETFPLAEASKLRCAIYHIQAFYKWIWHLWSYVRCYWNWCLLHSSSLCFKVQLSIE